MRTGLVWHELYMWHDTGTAAWVMPPGLTVEPLKHIENADGKRRLRNLVEVSGLLEHLVQLKPRPATEGEVLRLHTTDYVEHIRKASSERGGDAGELTPFGTGSLEIALLAAGGTITAVDAVLDGRVDNAYALVRPPGHHAEASRGRGSCSAWPSWTGTCTTATGHRRRSTPTPASSPSRSTRIAGTPPSRA